jgi:hypothetical protein
MRYLVGTFLFLVIAGPVCAGDLCKENSFTKTQATKGRWAFDSTCGLCHLFNLRGRVVGQSRSEMPDISVLPEVYLKSVDGNGGMTPSLISDAFFKKWKDQNAYADRIANATGAFLPKNYVKNETELQVAAYILYERCGQM